MTRVIPIKFLAEGATGARDTLASLHAVGAGAKVVGAMAIIDREEGGREVLEKAGLRVWSLFRKTDFLP